MLHSIPLNSLVGLRDTPYFKTAHSSTENQAFQKCCPRQIHLKTGVVGCHGTGGSLRLRGYNIKINMEGEMNMLLCLYNLLTGSLVRVLRVQVLFLNRYALLLRRRCALYSVCVNYEIPFKPYNERRFWVRRGRTFPEQLAGGTVCNSICLYAYIK